MRPCKVAGVVAKADVSRGELVIVMSDPGVKCQYALS